MQENDLELEIAEVLASAKNQNSFYSSVTTWETIDVIVRGYRFKFFKDNGHFRRYWEPNDHSFPVSPYRGCKTLEQAIRVLLQDEDGHLKRYIEVLRERRAQYKVEQP